MNPCKYCFALFKDLRKQARHLENEIDAKLVAFSKLGINTNTRHVTDDEVPLLNEEHVFDNMAVEIDALITKVSYNLIKCIKILLCVFNVL